MLNRRLSRESGPYRVEVESDSVGTEELLELLEKTVQEVNVTINEGRITQAAEQVPTLDPKTTPTDGIMKILESSYGRHPLTLGQIRVTLEANGIYFPVTTISSILISLHRRGRIRRWKVDGKFVHQKAAG